jgi:tryptophan 2,3-dioxygenase
VASALERYPAGSEARKKLEQRWKEPTLWDSFLRFLDGKGVAIPREALKRDVTKPVQPVPALHPVLIGIYRGNAVLASLCERLVDLDEGLQEWRYRHVKMVQRTIGAKMGTGGSAGAAYLMTTLNKPYFPDLWEIRSEL